MISPPFWLAFGFLYAVIILGGLLASFCQWRSRRLFKRVDNAIDAIDSDDAIQWRRVRVRTRVFAHRWRPLSVANNAGLIILNDRGFRLELVKPVNGESVFQYSFDKATLAWPVGTPNTIRNTDQEGAWFNLSEGLNPDLQIGSPTGTIDLYRQLQPGRPAPSLDPKPLAVERHWPLLCTVVVSVLGSLLAVIDYKFYNSFTTIFILDYLLWAVILVPATALLAWCFLLRAKLSSGDALSAATLVFLAAMLATIPALARLDQLIVKPTTVVYRVTRDLNLRPESGESDAISAKSVGLIKSNLESRDRYAVLVVKSVFGPWQIDAKSAQRVRP